MNDIELDEELELTNYVKFRNIASDTFTPFKIKDLTNRGRKNLGIYGVLSLTTIGVIAGMDIYALIKDHQSATVIINIMIPIVFALLGLFKLIASIIHFLFKRFQ